jgi:hypothetical protein
VAVIVASVTAKANEIAAVKTDAEKDLAEAQPAMDAAVEVSLLGDAKSSLGDVNISLGDVNISLGNTKSSLGDV